MIEAVSTIIANGIVIGGAFGPDTGHESGPIKIGGIRPAVAGINAEAGRPSAMSFETPRATIVTDDFLGQVAIGAGIVALVLLVFGVG